MSTRSCAVQYVLLFLVLAVSLTGYEFYGFEFYVHFSYTLLL